MFGECLQQDIYMNRPLTALENLGGLVEKVHRVRVLRLCSFEREVLAKPTWNDPDVPLSTASMSQAFGKYLHPVVSFLPFTKS